MIEIKVNGRIREIQEGTNVKQLLIILEVKPGIVVEHNRTILSSKNWEQVELKHGDVIEIVQIVGGG